MNNTDNDGGIKWGDPIKVDGVRPDWLKRDQIIQWIGRGMDWSFWEKTGPVTADVLDRDRNTTHIRLPHDHPYYTKPATIDWNGKLEAVHEDGRVVPVELANYCSNPDHDGDYCTTPVLDDGSNLWHPDGSNWACSPWQVRNVATPQQATPAVPQEVVERMVKLVRKVASSDLSGTLPEARAIVAMLEPVDEALVACREICALDALERYKDDADNLGANLAGHYRDGAYDDGKEMRIALAAYRRALAKEAGE